jgi:hypothetical protein
MEVSLFPGDGFFELAEASSQAVSVLRQSLGSEDQESHDQDDQDLERTDVADH